jgi:hypothetical protein
VFDQHRHLGGRIEEQKLLASLPGSLLDKLRRDLALAEDKPHEARLGGEGMVKKLDHS